ncbi:Rpr2-domain-containing protein [Hygrophoropsis aurantiaca]|uniref:Rpr2-domain-containing protein n=1 Tax=Hygrophoropsis aurantiaca TaxID=72124 RepID=A0ACB8AJT9_9AGAM|nr:Rpr2-domain-containing protein [Hygrophoropsis aurantiaca]
MGKKSKDDIPNPNSVSNRDIIQRLNFLYQASVLLGNVLPEHSNSTDPSSSSSNPILAQSTDKPRPRKKPKRVVTTSELSRSYVHNMKIVGQKTNVKMDPTIKRVLCKGCNVALVPGVTAKVRVKSSKTLGHLVTYSCTACNTVRRLPAPPTLPIDATSLADTTSNNAHETSASNQPGDSTTDDGVGPDREAEFVPKARKLPKKKPVPRLPPHFARDIGHVVFCGNEKLPVGER